MDPPPHAWRHLWGRKLAGVVEKVNERLGRGVAGGLVVGAMVR